MEPPVTVHPADETLVSYGLGKLDDTVAGTVSQHLEQCAPCRRRVADLSADSFVGRLRDAQPRPEEASGRPKTLVEAEPPRPSPAPEGQPSAKQPSPKQPSSKTPPSSSGSLPEELVNHPQYEVIRELGRGGMGVVYLARNKLMDRLEVLKVLGKEMLGKQGRADRFLREIQSAAKLHHPNVVAAYTAFPLAETLVFAMEYVEGDDLAKLVRARGPLPVLNACYFAYQTAQGLAHAHERGMIHRDVKPGNLILFRQGKKATVKILDFGLAKVTSEQRIDGTLTQQGQMLGTPDYIAPEQTLDAQKADIRADIYSLGCTLYHLLTGSPPFSGNTLYAVLQAHHATDAKSVNLVRPEVPVELAAVVAKMMAKDPSRRYQTPADVAQALKPFLKPGGLTSRQPELEPSVSQLDRPSATPAPAPMPDDYENPFLAPMPEVEASERWKSLIDTPSLTPSGARPAIRKPRKRQLPWLWAGVATAALLLGLVIAWAGGVFKVKTPDGVIVLRDLPDNAVVLVDGEKVSVRFPEGGGPAEIKVPPGKRGVLVKKDGFEVFGEQVSLASGDRMLLAVHLDPLPQGGSKAQELLGAAAGGIAGSDTDREVAQFVLSLGGTVAIRTGSEDEEFVKRGDGLPARAFRLVRVILPDKPELTDADVARLSGLTSLIVINIANAKKITDASLKELARLKQLEVIRVPGTGVTDAGLAHLQSLPKLRIIDLSRTTVSNAGLVHLQKLSQLDTLYLGVTHVTGAGLVDLENLTRLRQLYFWDQNVANAGLVHLKNLTQLETLELVGTGINDDGIVHLKGLSKLRRLNLYHTGVTGSCFADPGALAQITGLNLQWTPITDANLVHLRRLPQLEYLNLAYTRVTDAGLVHLRSLSKLKDLILTKTNVTGGQVESLRRSLVGCRIAADAVAVAASPNVAPEEKTSSQTRSADRQTEGFVPLFNGKDLGGWTAIENEGSWTVDDHGVLVGQGSRQGGKPLVLIADQANYRNFKLAIQILNAEGAAISAIVRRSASGSQYSGYGIMLSDTQNSAGLLVRRGSLYRADMFKLSVPLTWDPIAKPSHVGEWYTLEITAIGNHITTSVDGIVVAEYEDPGKPFESGGLALVGRSDVVVRIRGIEIQELGGGLRGFQRLQGGGFGGMGMGKGKSDRPGLQNGEDQDFQNGFRSLGKGLGGGLGGMGFGRLGRSDDADDLGFGPPSKERFVRLFNGNDFTNWTFPKGGVEKWSIEDGVLRGDGTSRIATARTDFKDFHLRMSVRTPDQINKHLIFRSRDVDGNDANYRFHLGGIRYDHKSTWPLGSYALLTGERLKPGESGTTEGLIKLKSVSVPFLDDKWHRVDIFALRNAFRMKLDDHEVSAFRDAQSRISHGQIMIGLVEGAHLELRDIEINEKLAKPPAAAPKKSPRKSSKPAPANDALREGTVWKGSRTYRKGFWEGVTVDYEIQVLKRLGPKFTGVKFDNGAGRNRLPVEGEIHGQSLAWREGTEWRMVGKLDGDTIAVEFHADFGNGKTEGSGQLKRSE